MLPWIVLATAFPAVYARFLRANLLVKRRATVAAPEAGPGVYLSIPIVIAVIVVLTPHVTLVMLASMITIATIVASMT